MTAMLTRLLGRLPIGWLQLVHKKSRLAAAIAGVAFANILIFMQLGFLGALMESIMLPYRAMDADVLVSASDANTLSDGSNLPRQRMFQALAVSGVEDAIPVYFAKLDWEPAADASVSLHVFGIDPNRAPAFWATEIAEKLNRLRLPDTALLDRKTRNISPAFFDDLASGKARSFEMNNKTIDIVDTVSIGAGFEADGYLFVSDQTFLRLFPSRVSGAPNHVLVNIEPLADRDTVVAALQNALPASDTIVRAFDDAAEADRTYQTTERPVGVVFGFGVIIGVLVGIIIVYQVLSTDVADHLKEYATFKAIGYRQRYFLGIVFEEAAILAVFGFVPGILIALGLYQVVSAVTGLPLVMVAERPPAVLFGTIAMCVFSGAIATRRLAGADPADLF